MKTYAKCEWTADDVMTMAEELDISMSEDEAESFLIRNQSNIRERMCERGWDAIQTLLEMESSD